MIEAVTVDLLYDDAFRSLMVCVRTRSQGEQDARSLCIPVSDAPDVLALVLRGMASKSAELIEALQSMERSNDPATNDRINALVREGMSEAVVKERNHDA